MLYGSTDIRVIQDGNARPDYDSAIRHLEATPGVLAAVVAWENEGKLDDWEIELAESARAGNPVAAAKVRLLSW